MLLGHHYCVLTGRQAFTRCTKLSTNCKMETCSLLFSSLESQYVTISLECKSFRNAPSHKSRESDIYIGLLRFQDSPINSKKGY